MKKFFKFLSVSVLILIVCMSCVACSFKIDANGNAGTNDNTTVTPSPGDNSGTSTTLPVTNNRDYTEIINSINKVLINQGSLVIPPADLSTEEAVELVELTSVGIYVIKEDGYDSGSGTIIDIKKDENDADTNVYVLTCHHVISSCGNIEVWLPDEDCKYGDPNYIFTGYIGEGKDNYAVSLVGGDKDSDIALIKLDLTKTTKGGTYFDKSKIVKAKIMDDYSVKKGQEVFAIGNPTGTLMGSVATGSISYLERETTISEVGNMVLLQMNTTINPGNSGGGLYNKRGQLIGVTNAGNTNYEAINFSIPVTLSHGVGEIDNGFLYVAKCLLGSQTSYNYGYVPYRKVKLGITITQDTSLQTVQISQVSSDGLASGLLKAGDIIKNIQINGVNYAIKTNDDFANAYKLVKVNEEMKFTVKRSGMVNEKIITITMQQYHFCDTGNYQV